MIMWIYILTKETDKSLNCITAKKTTHPILLAACDHEVVCNACSGYACSGYARSGYACSGYACSGYACLWLHVCSSLSLIMIYTLCFIEAFMALFHCSMRVVRRKWSLCCCIKTIKHHKNTRSNHLQQCSIMRFEHWSPQVRGYYLVIMTSTVTFVLIIIWIIWRHMH